MLLKRKTKNTPVSSSLPWPSRIIGGMRQWWNKNISHKILAVLLVVIMLFTGVFYGIGQWYIRTKKHEPYTFGMTFIPNYARYYGLDPQETMQAMIDELGIRQFRLVSYWKDGEPQQGQYNFSELDWQFAKANAAGAKVSLAIGLRQPRWPECHMPEWAAEQPMSVWSVELKKYMQQVIERYKDNPALQSYQLENEFFMDVFGICPDFTRERLIDEYHFVKQLDPSHPVIISRSNNWIGLPLYEPRPDEFAISVYKRVWDKVITKRYFEYPLPSWFYASLAGAGKIATGRDMIIHELQTEAWLPEGFQMNDIDDIPEQNKSISPERLKGRFDYAKGTGMKDIYLWGGEWWYWRKLKANDPSLWDTARQEISAAQRSNQKLQ